MTNPVAGAYMPASQLRWICIVAALSSLIVLPRHFVGEEAILAITSMEMRVTGDWSRHWLFGTDQLHVVFTNWLILPLADLLGWDHVLAVTRTIMIAATATTAATTYWFTRRCWGDAALGWLAAAIFLTFIDSLLYRGWLAYRDPLFAALIFGAVATLWTGARDRRYALVALSGMLVFCAFLTKGVTAYVFYASAGFVMLWHREERKALLTPGAVIPVVVAFAAALVWMQWVMAGRLGGRLSKEILDKLQAGGIGEYLWSLIQFPLDALLRLAPATIIVLWFAWRQRAKVSDLKADGRFLGIAAAALLCLLPYWLAPQTHIRYLMPVLPLIAMAFAAIALRAGDRCVKTLVIGMWVVVVLKVVLMGALFPWYQEKYRGANYAAAARDIAERAGRHPIYTTDVSASGLSVAAYIDIARMPDGPLLRFPPDGWKDGWVMYKFDDPAAGRKVKKYTLFGDEIHLYCRGTACAGAESSEHP